ncbi:unnamed protein product [Sphenostylis stenocarpa]|uniref:Albumin I chain a domain-containing protein n=1 Tax=Sphenostylis stenocarpa TaxID=92480 RepID=A0AA87BCP1_9FABA|nr:unnamed protein product [Sphenostylis stenocarpa]
MGYKHSAECTENSGEATVENVDVETVVEGSVVAEEGTGLVEENVKDHNKPISQNSNLSEWEARRYGTMTARILRDSVEADCWDICLTIDTQPCGSSVCSCVPVAVIAGICLPDIAVESIAKSLDEYPNLCVSHHDCVKKGSGNFCTRSLYPNVPFGWCSHSNTEPLKGFLAMPETIDK